MAKQFCEFLYKNVLQGQEFQILFNELLKLYTIRLIDKSLKEYDEKYNKLLRYADILSLSGIEEHQNIAQ